MLDCDKADALLQPSLLTRRGAGATPRTGTAPRRRARVLDALVDETAREPAAHHRPDGAPPIVALEHHRPVAGGRVVKGPTARQGPDDAGDRHVLVHATLSEKARETPEQDAAGVRHG